MLIILLDIAENSCSISSFFFSHLCETFVSLQKRYSLAVGPPKKDPKVKGVQSAAVRAFLKRQEEEQKKKGIIQYFSFYKGYY